MNDLPAGLHGAFTRSQLRSALGGRGVRIALRAHRVHKFARNVLIDAHRGFDLKTRAAAAVLAAGRPAVLVGFTAAALYGCTAALPHPIHIQVPYARRIRSRSGLVVHQGGYDDHDVGELDGLPVLMPDLVIANLLCQEFRWRALACFDQVLAAMPPSARGEFKAEVAERIRTRADRRGTLRAELMFELASGKPESPQESRLLLTLVDAGLTAPVPQYEVCTLAGTVVYRLDFAWPELKVALEYDGYEAHENRVARDSARDEDLRRRGWIVVRAQACDLQDPGALITRLRIAFAQRRLVA